MQQHQQHFFKIGTKIASSVLLLMVAWYVLTGATVQNAIIQFLFAGVVPISHRVLTPDSVIYGVSSILSVIFLGVVYRILRTFNVIPEIHLLDTLPDSVRQQRQIHFPLRQISNLELLKRPPASSPTVSSSAASVSPETQTLVFVPVVVASPPLRKPISMPRFEMPKAPKLDWQIHLPSFSLPHFSLPIPPFSKFSQKSSIGIRAVGRGYTRVIGASNGLFRQLYQGAPRLIKPPLQAVVFIIDGAFRLVELLIKYVALGVYIPIKTVLRAVWFVFCQAYHAVSFVLRWTLFVLKQSLRYIIIGIRTFIQGIVLGITTIYRSIIFAVTWTAVMVYRVLTRSLQLLFHGTVITLKATRKSIIWTLTTAVRLSVNTWWWSEPYLRRYDRWLEKNTKKTIKKANYRLRRYDSFQIILDIVRAIRFELGRLGIGKSVELYRHEHKRRQI